MIAPTQRRARPGRAGSRRANKKACWEANYALRTVLETVDEPRLRIDAAAALVHGCEVYATLLPEEKASSRTS